MVVSGLSVGCQRARPLWEPRRTRRSIPHRSKHMSTITLSKDDARRILRPPNSSGRSTPRWATDPRDPGCPEVTDRSALSISEVAGRIGTEGQAGR